jgi:hypothetical protein
LDQRQSKEVTRSDGVPVPPPGMNSHTCRILLWTCCSFAFQWVAGCCDLIKYNSNRQCSIYSLLVLIECLCL